MGERQWRPELADQERRGADFLSQVHEVCRLRVDQDRSTAGAEITERDRGAGGAAFDHLVVRYMRGPRAKELAVGAWDRTVDVPTVRRFADAVCAHVRTEREPELVFRGDGPDQQTVAVADELGVWLREFGEYQQVWEHQQYLAAQSTRLRADREYPLDKHVDKRWSQLGEQQAQSMTAAQQIMSWLDTDGPRFVLVLGDFGTGKTFLLRTIAQRLASGGLLVPVLVTMRDLTKGRTLDQLLAQHMSGEDSYHRSSFRYLLRQGRIALLFDGFDELAQRTDYRKVVDHFATLREAADGAAKVLVTSRHQYFATDSDVRTALGGQAQALPGSRIMRLLPLDPGQRRALVVEDFDDEAAAERFLQLLGSVRDLLDLASNPRMLSFMIHWHREGLLDADKLAQQADGPITAGRLYERLLTTWLEHEYRRQDEPGGPGALFVGERMGALTEVALRMWRTGEAAVQVGDLGSLTAKVADLARLQLSEDEAAQTVGSSTVLVRVGDGAFGFIHQSVMEWLVARWLADEFAQPATPREVGRLGSGELTPLMADFVCDLADQALLLSWARRTVQATEGVERAAKVNAQLILQRLGVTVDAASYREAKLAGRDLSTQDFTNADLSGADLSGSVLPRAMRGARLRGATLVAARLTGADLTGADLTGADLRKAWLAGADLTGADLTGARLDRAVLLGATVSPTQLAQCVDSTGAALPQASVTPQLAASSTPTCLAAVGTGLLASGHGDGTVRLWDPHTGHELRTLAGHTMAVTALVAANGGQWLVSASNDHSIRVWDANTGEPVRTLADHTARVTSLGIDRTGLRLASTGGDRTIRLWDVTTGSELTTITGAGGGALALDPWGRWVAATEHNSGLQIWDPETGIKLRTIAEPVSSVHALAADPDGQWLAAVNTNNSIQLFDPLRGRPLRLASGHTAHVRALVAGPDGRWLASASNDRTVRLWDPLTGLEQHTLTDHTNLVGALATAADGSWLASAGTDRTIRLWNPTTGDHLRTLTVRSDRLKALAADPDGRWFATGNNRTVQLWNFTTGEQLRTIAGHDRPVNALAVHPQGRWVASADYGGDVRLWEPGTGKHLRTLHGHTDWVRALVVDPQGQWLASASDDNTVRLWNPGNGAELGVLTGHTDWVTALAVDPQGQWLASASHDRTVRLWNPPPVRKPRRWGRGSGAPIHTLVGHTNLVDALAADPRGRWLASAGADRTIRLWDPDSGEELRALTGHTNWVTALAVHPNGRWLASAGNDHSIQLWDPDSGQPLHILAGHADSVTTLAVHPNGRWLASAGTDRTVRLWHADQGTLLATLVTAEDGWAVLLPDGSFKVHGRPVGLWWAAGLCRFETTDLPELAPVQPQLRQLPDDAEILSA